MPKIGIKSKETRKWSRKIHKGLQVHGLASQLLLLRHADSYECGGDEGDVRSVEEGSEMGWGDCCGIVAPHGKGDICDKLAGDYPKDFKFTGWHPNCFCYATPIVMSAEEMKTMLEARRRGEKYVSPNLVTKYPDGFAV